MSDRAAATASTAEAPLKPKTPPPVLAARGLVKVFGKRRVVNGVDLEIRQGEIVGLLGPNGAGKTTTFYMVVGLVPATSGQVFVNGRDVTERAMHERARLGLGYLPQEASAFRKLTVEENVMAIAETLNLTAAERRKKVDEALAELGLTRLAKQPAYTLSGGERRRLEISRALVTSPQALLLDEPFAGVDPISVAEVQGIIRQLRTRGLAILITDHNVRETLSIVDRAYLLFDGRVLTQGSGDFLINDPEARRLYLGQDFKL